MATRFNYFHRPSSGLKKKNACHVFQNRDQTFNQVSPLQFYHNVNRDSNKTVTIFRASVSVGFATLARDLLSFIFHIDRRHRCCCARHKKRQTIVEKIKQFITS